jgi:DNA invertase Pin-like site-specific DNA recombinase
MESKISFKVVNVPEANKFMLHILAAVAEQERDQISERTKASLEAAKRKGTVLGRHGKMVLAPRNRQLAKLFASKMRLTLYRLSKEGFTTIREITEELNRRQVPTYHKKNHKWHLATVHKIIRYLNQNRNNAQSNS